MLRNKEFSSTITQEFFNLLQMCVNLRMPPSWHSQQQFISALACIWHRFTLFFTRLPSMYICTYICTRDVLHKRFLSPRFTVRLVLCCRRSAASFHPLFFSFFLSSLADSRPGRTIYVRTLQLAALSRRNSSLTFVVLLPAMGHGLLYVYSSHPRAIIM